MDHNSSKGTGACGCGRMQKPVPPCMNTNCSCRGDIRPTGTCRPSMVSGTPGTSPAGAAFIPNRLPAENTVMPVMPDRINAMPCTMSGMPIGMGYVPWQRWNQTYPISQAFQQGTIFPELDLPFAMGRCR